MKEEKDKLLKLLNEILDTRTDRLSKVKMFQNTVWNIEDPGDNDYEIFNDLAYDLDYYEPDEEKRKEDDSFYGDDRLVSEIQNSLKALDHSAA